MILVTKRKYEKDLNIAYEQVNEALKELNKIQEESKNINSAWIKEKQDLLNQNKNYVEEIDKLNTTCQNLEIVNSNLLSNVDKLKKEVAQLSSSNGGLKSGNTRKDKKIQRLEEELRKSNPAFYKIRKLKAQKTPRVEQKTIIKNQKNSQVKAQLKSLGENK